METTATTPASPPPRTERVGAFAAQLARLVDTEDRAALAALRRGLGKAPGDVAAMHPLIVPFLPDDGNARDDEAWYLVGSLFGLHPEPWRASAQTDGRGPSFGATLKRLRDAKGDAGGPGIDRRMVAILNAHRDDVGAFDEEGFYRTGDAVVFIDPARPTLGLKFDGRTAEDFKLSTGTFVSVGPLRAKIIAAGHPCVMDAVITGINRNDIEIGRAHV